MNGKLILLVGFGGMIGSICRYLAGFWIKSNPFPFATFWVNMAGALIIGGCMAWYHKFPEQEPLKLFLVAGICGGFTTFSAFAWENWQLLQDQRYLLFCIYSFGTLILGLIAVAIGYRLINNIL
ncbi:MAG: fluoride efflux transporter CrcB [Chitinophagaceae bacterium]|jgi:CrcB protein|nr:fluoride efflux transporter CrcB [Chitinophagaceae bacterium]